MARPRKRPDLTPLQKAMLRNVYMDMDSYATSGEAREAAEHDKDLQPGLASQLGADIGQMGADAPRGYYELLKAGTLDTRDFVVPNPGDSSKDTFPRLRALGGGLASSLKEDIRHPLRHPGYTLMDLAIGGGTAAKVPATFGRAARAARAIEPKQILKAPPRDMLSPPKRSLPLVLASGYARGALKTVPKPRSVLADAALVRSGAARERVREAKAAKAAAQIRRTPPVRRSGR